MDLSSLTFDELQDLQKRIPAEMKRREKQQKVLVLNEVKALAEARGFTIEELLEKEAKTSKRGSVKVKYRHPQDANLAWTGRGRTPKWVVQWQADGNKLEALLV
ncbi:MAG: Histone-like nucleoid-structuring protein [Proteobacteria bacterium]|nr:Histone-like nucleoid-structuring protein [Pseudomonadota bacterium]